MSAIHAILLILKRLFFCDSFFVFFDEIHFVVPGRVVIYSRSVAERKGPAGPSLVAFAVVAVVFCLGNSAPENALGYQFGF